MTEKQKRVSNPKAVFPALLLLYGKAPYRAYVNKHPESKWGVAIRSVGRAVEANDYELPIIRYLRERYASPQRIFYEFLRWQYHEGLIDLSIRKATGVRKDGSRDYRFRDES